MSIQLSQVDLDKLTEILSQHGEWLSVRGRIDFMGDVFSGSARKASILSQLDLDGTPRSTAVRTIQRLMTFGRDEPGRESLGVLINKLIAYLGGGDQADFLRDLLVRYPFATKPVAVGSLGDWRGRETEEMVAEKIIGENTLRDIYVLEVLLELARGVVRIRGPQGLGTGFLVAEDLLLTNNHVIASEAAAKQSNFEFDYQLTRTGAARPVHLAKALDGGTFRTSPMAPYNAGVDQLDYTIVQLSNVPPGVPHLTLSSSTVERDGRVTIIQHPGGDYKKISMQNNFVEYVDDYVVQYTTSTEPGSSGSPVLGDDFTVVAIHHAGGNLSEPSSRRRYLRNEGIRVAAILNDLLKNEPHVYRKIVN
jgi:V8-like Glu-specific endopeptidase